MTDSFSLHTWKQRVAASGYTPGRLPRAHVGVLPTWAVATAPFPQSKLFRDDVWRSDAGRLGRLELGLWTHRTGGRIPRGTAARWALLLLCRGVVGRSSLDLGDSVGDVMQVTGGNESGGARSGRQGLRQAVVDVLQCGFFWTVGDETQNVSPVLGLEGLGTCRDPLQIKITRLNGLFVRSVRAGVPVDLRALRLLERSSLGWDLLVFLAWRVRSVRQPTIVRWSWLYDQLGSRMQDRKTFRKRVRESLLRVRVLYPTLEAEPVREGLLLHPSPPMFKIVDDAQKTRNPSKDPS